MEDKYTITIFWSEEDDAYIAKAEELEGCSAFGDTREKALQEVRTAIDLWLQVAKEYDDEIPQPKKKPEPIKPIKKDPVYAYH
jgi:predicted RNase H-like HicB family nuclease